MASFVKAPSGKWNAVIRMSGWPTLCKTFRLKRDAKDWSKRTEDQMVCDVFIDRADPKSKSRVAEHPLSNEHYS